MTVQALLNAPDYAAYLSLLQARLGQAIVQDDALEAALAPLQNEWLGHAQVSVNDLLTLIRAEPQQTQTYIAAKLAKFSEPDGGPDNIVNEPLGRNFPVGHLIEYALQRQRPDALPAYVAQLRLPGAKAYLREIRECFTHSNGPLAAPQA